MLIYQLNQGFDEFMNVVLDEAAEVYVKEAQPRRELGMFATSNCANTDQLLSRTHLVERG